MEQNCYPIWPIDIWQRGQEHSMWHGFYWAKTKVYLIKVDCCCRSVMSNSLWPHGLQHARLPYPSLSPRICSDSKSIESVMPSNHLFLCGLLLLLPSIFPSTRVFSNEKGLRIRWPKYWSFSISSSNEYSGLVSFSTNWFDFLAVQESWTIKKTEHWRIDAFKLWWWRRLLRVPWIAKRLNQSTLKEINPE